MLMVTNYTNMCMPKVISTRIDSTIPPPPIHHTSLHRPIDGTSPLMFVDQLNGLATSLASLGLNPSQTGFTFTTLSD